MSYRGLLSRGYPLAATEALPHADLPDGMKAAVIEACRVAWARLVDAINAEGGSAATMGENALSSRMKEVLNDILTEDPSPVHGFTCALFETVSRDSTVVTYNGSSVDKKPDLVFRPIQKSPGLRLSEYRALFTECKVLDRTHPVRDYCDHGILRFVNGEYAWAMPSALMLAYVRGQRTIGTTLGTYLRKPACRRRMKMRNRTLGRLAEPPHISHHRRAWLYDGGHAPGDIALLHLWLS